MKGHAHFTNYDKQVMRVLFYTLWLNLAVSLAKLFYGIYTQSLSLESDGFHSLFDTASNVVGLVSIYFASKPADDKHPYGHRKIETLASMGIAFMLFLTCYEILTDLYERYYHPVVPHVDVLSFAIMIVTLAINFGVSRYEKRKGHELRSEILHADAAHTHTDVLVSISVMASFVGVLLHWVWIDLVVAFFIVLVIVHAGYEIIVHSLSSLLDEQFIDPKEIETMVMSVPEVEGCHKIRSRGTLGKVFVDLHIYVHPLMTLEKAHSLTHVVIDTIKKQKPEIQDVLIHTEPSFRTDGVTDDR
ncbi:cation diffusion facilitator family transporter [bacterium]|nr:cation diffusion facilitator family transporter [bacterium]